MYSLQVGDDGIVEEEEEESASGGPVVSKEELNLTCYNLMIDVVHSQMDTQAGSNSIDLL